MDTLTHSLLGAVTVRAVARTPSARHTLTNKQLLLTGAVAAAFPDSDYIGAWIDPMVYLTVWHRSITHSLVLLPLWALLIGVLLAWAFRKRDQWRWLVLFAGVSVLSHILSDLITVYGTQILSPLSTWRASIGTTFIIDPWFTLIVIIGVISSVKTQQHRYAGTVLGILMAYIGMQALIKQQALSVAHAHSTRTHQVPVRTTALPQPFSPFNWKLMIDYGETYATAYVNLSGGYAFCSDREGFWGQVCDTYRTPENLNWQRVPRFGNNTDRAASIRALWDDPQLDYFRRFAEYPALYRIDEDGKKVCVWFTDLRYKLPYMKAPFRYGLCSRHPSPDWLLKRLKRSAE